ncbi:MAG: GNAT family N-acetyltransferase [Gemmatimonadales bacterium]|jgi:N-acetylglutamate synthase-like GNAT family acetyltransferase|nr:MAG: GNAT family N-acetyltransferase [Gemmatimonadales bacterium]
MTLDRTLGGDDRESGGVGYRPPGPGDLGWIVQRHGELYSASHGWDRAFEAMVAQIVADFVRDFDPAWARMWIAEVGGRRAGSVALVRRSETVGQLRLLLVEPWARGRGIGRRLVSECVGHARHLGYRRMVLSTVRGLDAAQRLYEAEGFHIVSEEPTELWGGRQVAQTWELEL